MRAFWSDKQNCSHNVSQKVKRIRRPSDKRGKQEVTAEVKLRLKRGAGNLL